MVKVIVGLMGSSAGSTSAGLSKPDQLRTLLASLIAHSIRELDTARVYGGGSSEKLLGEVVDVVNAESFEIATKAPGFSKGSLTHDKIISNCDASLAAMKQKSIDLYYFHGPDRQTPLEESCRAMQELYEQGKFARWGVSNLHVDEVNEIMDICSKNAWIKPTIYQGVYNPLTRAMEPDLLPTLRKYKMAFYGYSPLAGGYFSRPLEQLRDPEPGSRMDNMKIFHSMYVNDVSLKLREGLDQACGSEKDVGSIKEATLRWFMHHSALKEEDGIILGGASVEQLQENLVACEAGPLPQRVVDAFEDMWVQYKEAGKATTYCIPK